MMDQRLQYKMAKDFFEDLYAKQKFDPTINSRLLKKYQEEILNSDCFKDSLFFIKYLIDLMDSKSRQTGDEPLQVLLDFISDRAEDRKKHMAWFKKLEKKYQPAKSSWFGGDNLF